METAEKIAEYVRRLPEKLQAEVLDFVSFLLSRAEQNGIDSDRTDWNQLSLESAMRGLDTDDEPEYGEDDLKEVYS